MDGVRHYYLLPSMPFKPNELPGCSTPRQNCFKKRRRDFTGRVWVCQQGDLKKQGFGKINDSLGWWTTNQNLSPKLIDISSCGLTDGAIVIKKYRFWVIGLRL